MWIEKDTVSNFQLFAFHFKSLQFLIDETWWIMTLEKAPIKEESLKVFRHSKIYNKYRKYNLYIYVYCWKIIFETIGIEKKCSTIFLESYLRGAKYNPDFSRSTRRFHPRRIELCRKTKDDDGEAVSLSTLSTVTTAFVDSQPLGILGIYR